MLSGAFVSWRAGTELATWLVLGGRSHYRNAEAREAERLRRKREGATPRGRTGELMEERESPATAIPPSSPRSPFRAGTGFFCPQDRLTYRVVASLDMGGGWVTSEFFQRRWLIAHSAVLGLARAGLLDAAMLEGSAVRRYRCRDEARVLRSEPVLRAALKRRQDAQGPEPKRVPKKRP